MLFHIHTTTIYPSIYSWLNSLFEIAQVVGRGNCHVYTPDLNSRSFPLVFYFERTSICVNEIISLCSDGVRQKGEVVVRSSTKTDFPVRDPVFTWICRGKEDSDERNDPLRQIDVKFKDQFDRQRLPQRIRYENSKIHDNIIFIKEIK